MLTESSAIASRPATARSKITNGSLGIDGRSREARRYRDLIEAFGRDLGPNASEHDRQLVRRAAAATVRAEQLEVAMLKGEPIDDAALVRLQNAAMRALSALKARKRGRGLSNPSSLTDYLAAKRPAG